MVILDKSISKQTNATGVDEIAVPPLFKSACPYVLYHRYGFVLLSYVLFLCKGTEAFVHAKYHSLLVAIPGKNLATAFHRL